MTIMLPIEISVFVIMGIVVFKLKEKYDNILFPPYGTTVFLPPDQADVKEIKDQSNKKQKAPPTVQIMQARTLKCESKQFTQMPFSNEMELTIIFLYLMISHFFLIEAIKLLGQAFDIEFVDSSMLFYFGIVLLFQILRNLLKAATIGLLDAQQKKLAIIVSLVSTVVSLIIFLGFKDFITINIRHEMQRQASHLEIVLRGFLYPGIWTTLSQYSDFFIVLLSLLIGGLTYATLPVVIRFGNSFTELKDRQNDKTMDKEVKKAGRNTFIFLALQLIVPFIYIGLHLTPFVEGFPHTLSLKFLTITIQTILAWQTYVPELDMHMFKAYDWLSAAAAQPEYYELMVNKVRALLRGMVVVAYQMITRILIPVVLMILLISRHDESQNQLPARYLEDDAYCVQKQINIMDFIFNETVIEDQPQDQQFEQQKILVKKVSKYNILSRSFIYSILEFFLLNYMLLICLLSLFYIFFLTKTKKVQTKSKKQ
ncbi:hypothetical protein pb186bvf_012788 [Paramecium bursaria]